MKNKEFKKRCILEIDTGKNCPGTMTGQIEKDLVVWRCDVCNAILYEPVDNVVKSKNL